MGSPNDSLCIATPLHHPDFFRGEGRFTQATKPQNQSAGGRNVLVGQVQIIKMVADIIPPSVKPSRKKLTTIDNHSV